MSKGVLYGVGVGPGDPALMTLKAVRVLERCPVVAAPRTPGGAMTALDIARGAVDLSGKIILPLDFAMHRDAGARAAGHRRAAELVGAHLDRGQSVAMLNLGDVAVYASYRYVADILGPLGYSLEMISGVTSFSAAAAALGVPLTDMDSTITIVPDGGEGGGDGDDPLARPGTIVFMKSGRGLPALLARIRERGLAGSTMLVRNCGLPGETVCRSLGGADPEESYFTVVIVKVGGEGRADGGAG